MALKRKFGTETSIQPTKKAAKTKERSRKESKSVSANVRNPEEAKEDLPSDDEFRDSDMDQNEPLSTDDEEDSDSDTDELDNQSETSEAHSPTTSNTNGVSTVPPPKEVPAHAAQRALAKERKLQRPNANTLHQAKLLWESLRLQKQSKSSRKAQVDQLFSLIQGDIPTLVFGHSASRFVQTAMKYGSSQQRLAIAKELQGRYIELIKAKYGKFLVGKVLEYGDREVRDMVVKEVLGNVGRLIGHKEAGMVVNDIYRDICTPSQKLEFLQELYGPEFRLFKSEKGMSLKQILLEKPEKKEMISKNLIEMVRNCMKKDIINLELVHTALLQALEISTVQGVEELVSLFKDQIHQLVHTKDGAHAACLLISHGNAKDRKAMIKSIREMIVPMSVDQYGHMVLIVLCAVVDDTKLVSKAILAELKPSCHQLVVNKWGRKIGLFLCREDNDPLVKECREKSASTSKKDTQIRRQELLESISEELITTATSKTEELIRDPMAIQIVQEIILYTRGNKSDLVDKVISLASGDPTEDSHIIKLPFTARVYKTLVQGGHFNAKAGIVEVSDPDLNFASKLKPVIQPYLVSWATGEGSFVVLGLLEALSGKEKEDVVSHLKKTEKSIRNKGAGNKGAKLILEKTLEKIS